MCNLEAVHGSRSYNKVRTSCCTTDQNITLLDTTQFLKLEA